MECFREVGAQHQKFESRSSFTSHGHDFTTKTFIGYLFMKPATNLD